MFSPHWRDEALQRASEGVDILVVGGGITGCGIALDAARRGLSCLLLEKGDLASGTSSRSSKLIHGGLRYLRQMQLGLTRAACRERDRMIASSPCLVQSIPCLYPAYLRDRTPGWLVGLGLGVYDLLTKTVERHRRLDLRETEEYIPGLDTGGLKRALLYHDGRADDARLTLAVAAAAAAEGAAILSRCRVEGLRRQPDGRIDALIAEDLEKVEKLEIRTRLIVNAAGAWVDEIRHRLGLPGKRLRPSRGSHLIFGPDFLPIRAALTFSSPVDDRPVFFVPHPEGLLLGTTDLFHEGDLDDPRPSAEERDYLLCSAGPLFPDIDLEKGIRGAFAGLRPILDSNAKTPSEASRDEEIWHERGILNVAGGKLTTWRLMAEETLDEIRRLLPAEIRRKMLPCSTRTFALPGWTGIETPGKTGIDPAIRDGLRRRLGSKAHRLIKHAGTDDLRPLDGAADLCRAEIRAHLRGGAMLHLEDLFLRRIRLGMWHPAVVPKLLPQIEGLVREERDWDLGRWKDEERRLEEALAAWRG